MPYRMVLMLWSHVNTRLQQYIHVLGWIRDSGSGRTLADPGCGADSRSGYMYHCTFVELHKPFLAL